MNNHEKKPKVIATYLPQYHRIIENDQWWGEGFTEWTNVKKAVPLFPRHIQPRIPLNKNYYDLSDPDIMLDQMNLAKEYGLDGFCFYHYWFKNGKQLLEKPVDQLLGFKKIPLPFMFCWANEPWTRTWDGAIGAKHILMEQEYGNRSDWERHFEYFLPFFEVDEYIKVEGKPVICIYRPAEIPEFTERISLWNSLAKKNGFKKGIYLVNFYRGGIPSKNDCYCDALADFEPFATIWRMGKELLNENSRECFSSDGKEYSAIDYRGFCQYLINHYNLKGINHFRGLFMGWDNTPRRGKDTRIIFENNTPSEFGRAFEYIYKESKKNDKEFIFINAWNEWGEGTFLEPDEKYKYGYLKELLRVKKT